MWDLVERILYRGHRYTWLVPFGDRVLTPWFDTSGRTPFSQAYRVAQAGGPTIVAPDRSYMLHQFLLRSLLLEGDVAEAGVYTGGTAHLLAETIRAAGSTKALHLFDSFEGMPDTADAERDYNVAGELSDTSAAGVQDRLRGYDFARFHVGFIPATFDEVDPEARFAFVHSDLDIYPSTLHACRWFWPRLTPGGVMIFDDYGFFPYRHAARAAVDEFFADQRDKPLILPTGQGLVIKS